MAGKSVKTTQPLCQYDDNDVELNVVECQVDIFGTNCNILLKLKMSGGEGEKSLQLQYM